MDKTQIIIRDANKGDEALIYASWLLGLRHGNEMYGLIDKEVYFDRYKRVISELLKQASIKMACLSDDPDVVLGYIVYRHNTLDWIFVKKAWRKLGIAKKLLPDTISTYSHITSIGKQLKRKDWKYNPFL